MYHLQTLCRRTEHQPAPELLRLVQPPRQNLTLSIDPGLDIAPVSALAIFGKKCFSALRSADGSDSPTHPKAHPAAANPAGPGMAEWEREQSEQRDVG